MTEPSLASQYADLQAERDRSWAPEALQANAGQRAKLVERYDPRSHVQPGEEIEPFELLDVTGGTLTPDGLLREGPLALIFFRFAGCPACNIALPHYERTLWPALRARGIGLVAVSPQVPERLQEIRTRHGLTYRVASDPDNALGNRLGITFEPDTKPEVAPGASWIGAVTGTNSWILPQPAVILIDRDAIVRFVDVSPDWLKRTEAETLLAAVADEQVAA